LVVELRLFTCTVKKIYDQTAAGNCTGSCDLIQATIVIALYLLCRASMVCRACGQVARLALFFNPLENVSSDALHERGCG